MERATLVHPQDYVKALAALSEADLALRELLARLRSFTDRAERFPGETCFVDLPDEETPKLDELMPGARWYVPEFPTPARLQAALRARVLARKRALDLWDGLTAVQRKGAPRVPK